MTQAASSSGRFNIANAFSSALSLVAQLCIGLLLVLFASLLAVMTAIAGVLLASAALFMRYAGRKGPRTAAREPGDEPLTLDARRTPRGWTVE